MEVYLDKKDMLNLVNGISPNQNLFEDEEIKKFGRYSDAYSKWTWDLVLLETEYNKKELLLLYKKCKSSWL